MVREIGIRDAANWKEVIIVFDGYEDLLEIETARGLLHMGRNSIYAALRNGELKGYQQGRRWRIPKEAIVEYVSKRSGIKHDARS